MKTVGTLITDVSAMANDQRPGHAFTRWGRGFLLDALNSAFAEVGTYRKEAFAEYRDIELTPGQVQTVPATVRAVHSIVANKNGIPVYEADLDLIKSAGAYCPAQKIKFDANGNPIYAVRSFATDKSNEKVFYVSPPVPKGLKVTVVANVIPNTPVYTLQDWDKPVAISSDFINNVTDFMMGRINENDTTSAEARANAIMYMTRFYTVMGVKYKIDSAFRSGYYRGEVGTGDPAARIT